MPLYTYRCACGHTERAMVRIAERDDTRYCTHAPLPTPMERVFEAPMVGPDYAAYDCPVTGRMIEGRRAHRENLKRHGARVAEPGERQEAQARAKAEEESLIARVGESVEADIAALPAEKRERLGAEMEHGLDVNVERTTGKVQDGPR